MIGKTISHSRIVKKFLDLVGTGGEGGMPSIMKKYNGLVPPNKTADQRTDPRSGRWRK